MNMKHSRSHPLFDGCRISFSLYKIHCALWWTSRPVQGVPRLSPDDHWDRLQPPRDPTDRLDSIENGWMEDSLHCKELNCLSKLRIHLTLSSYQAESVCLKEMMFSSETAIWQRILTVSKAKSCKSYKKDRAQSFSSAFSLWLSSFHFIYWNTQCNVITEFQFCFLFPIHVCYSICLYLSPELLRGLIRLSSGTS